MFLRFLCLCYLHDQSGVSYALHDLYELKNYVDCDSYILDWNIFMGQAHHILENFRTAIAYFNKVVELEQLRTSLKDDMLLLNIDITPVQCKKYAEVMINEIRNKL